MTIRKTLAAACVALAVAGCASVGNENIRHVTEQALGEKLAKGKTTKAEVRAHLGTPDETSFTDSGNEIWRYVHVKSTAKGVNFIPVVNVFASGANQEKKEVVLFFNQQGVLVNYTMNTTHGEVRQGVFAH